jgi:hypothetical protein
MDENFILLWGTLAFILAVGPLTVAAFLDYRDKQQK